MKDRILIMGNAGSGYSWVKDGFMTTYEWIDKLDSLEKARQSAEFYMQQAYERGDTELYNEFEAKKEAIDNEIKTLLQ